METTSGLSVQLSSTTQANESSQPLQSDIAKFQESLAVAGGDQGADATGPVTKAFFDPLESINSRAAELNNYANKVLANGAEMTPSDVLMLTVKSQEFLFHSQLTANIANRSADGVQTLFRQQS